MMYSVPQKHRAQAKEDSMNNIEEQILVRHLDPDGICRAWAAGPAQDRLEILELADQHLAEYRIEKASHRDPLAEAVYTRTEEIFAE
jgi:hypothetical protein